VRLWRLDDPPALVATLGAGLTGFESLGEAEVTALCFEPRGKVLAVAFGGVVKLWDPEAGNARSLGESSRVMTREADTFHQLAFSPDVLILAVGSLHGKRGLGFDRAAPAGDVRLLDARTGQRLTTFDGHSGAVYWLAFSADGRSLASAALVHKGDGLAVEQKSWSASK
jgi:WD40 repeat protein